MDVKLVIFLLFIAVRKWNYYPPVSASDVISNNVIHQTCPALQSTREKKEADVYYQKYEVWSYPKMRSYKADDQINIALLYINEITVRDNTPRNLSHSIEFDGCRNDSPEHVILRETIHTKCSKPDNTCNYDLQFGMIPKLLGQARKSTFLKLSENASSCDQLLPQTKEFLCYAFAPEYHPLTKQKYPPYKEKCYSYLDTFYSRVANKIFIHWSYGSTLNRELRYIATYENQGMSSIIDRFWPDLVDIVKISLLSNETLQSSTITFTDESDCASISKIHFFIVVLVLVLLVILFVIMAVRYKIKFKKARSLQLKKQNATYADKLQETENPVAHEEGNDPEMIFGTVTRLKRKRSFDATIFYHFDSDDDFIINYILPELEEFRDFNIYIHSRNITPGRDIKDNIEEAIEGSNSAIIVMSQGFVDSIWCKEEFTHCYIENMKDPTFNLFVIMMQPADTLVNTSNYMKTYFANRTYLVVSDPELFTKLATHLENARQPEYDDEDNESNGIFETQ